MKKNTAFNLLIIIALAALFRFNFLDKPEGLWNDEYNGVFIASINDISLFIKKIFQNCHTPLYYLYLKFWMIIFGDNDLSLRISSVIPSLLSVPVMYAAGKEIKNENTGYLAAFITAISSFCIYFAQEVRLYSLIFAVSALICFYFFKSVKNPDKKNTIIFFILQGILCSLHTLGIIFCFFITAGFLKLYLKDNPIKNAVNLKIPFIILFLFISALFPLLYKIAFSNMYAQFWSTFSLPKILYNFTDYFSPLQLNISNSPSTLTSEMIKNGVLNYKFILFGIIPMMLGLYAIITFLRKKTAYNVIFYSSAAFYLLLVFFAATGKMVLSTKYSCEIYPVLIIGVAGGFLSEEKEKIKKALIIIFTGLNLLFLVFSPDAVQKLSRPEGHKAVADLIKETGLSKDDIILLTYYDTDRFDRYINTNEYDFRSINKFNFNWFIFDNPDFKNVIKNGKFLYKNELKQIPNENIYNYMNNFVLYKTGQGKKAAIIYLNNVSFYTADEIRTIISDEKKYKKSPFIFLVFSSLRNNIDYYMNEQKCLKMTNEKQKGDWTIKVYERTD